MAERREGDLYRSASVVDSVGKRVGFLEMPKLIVPDQGSFPGKNNREKAAGDWKYKGMYPEKASQVQRNYPSQLVAKRDGIWRRSVLAEM